MLHLAAPSLFTADFAVVGCLCIHDGHILLLQRAGQRSHPGCWGSPGGKLLEGEAPKRGALRELFEETGLVLSEDNLTFVQRYYVTDSPFQFTYDLFLVAFTSRPEIRLDATEHTEARWLAAREALSLILVPHHDALLLDQLPRLQERHSQYDFFGHTLYRPRRSVLDIENEARRSLGNAGDLLAVNVTQPWYAALGPPAAGKTTTLKAMRHRNPRLQILRSRELVRRGSHMNRLLSEATDIQQDYSYFQFQMAVLPMRSWQLVKGRAKSPALLDETHFSALAYSRALYDRALLSESHYASFVLAYTVWERILPPPSAVFYCDCPTSVLMDRLRMRAANPSEAREHERLYTVEYVASLVRAFAGVARELSQVTQLVHIDTSRTPPHEIAEAHTPL
jgi:8-oxo-dGTP diphosphatase